jgi:hypothetical protein
LILHHALYFSFTNETFFACQSLSKHQTIGS